MLFLISINDLSFTLTSNSVLYADDCSLYAEDNGLNNLKIRMNDYYQEAKDWFDVNGFKLNVSKTQKLFFTLRHVLENDYSEHVNFLGIILDPKLTWEEHIQFMCVRLSRVICLLRFLTPHVSKCYLKQAYIAFFHGVLSYGVHICGNCSNIDKVLVLQKKAF